MEENWYALQQQARDRIAEARADALGQTLMRELTPPHRRRYAVGIALIRLGGWLLARRATLPIELSRALATLRAAVLIPTPPTERRPR
jgi:hypothetical protein